MRRLTRQSLPHWLKKALRFLRYGDERRRFFRELRIKKEQNLNLNKFEWDANNLIVFFVPGAERTGKETIAGGVISLVSLCEETARLEAIHKSITLACTFPRAFLLLKHVNFDNSTWIYRFEQICHHFKNVKRIIIHLPEFGVEHFRSALFESEIKWLKKIGHVHINIINANILLMPPPRIVNEVSTLATKTTITAAHSKYCNPYYRNLYGVPLHKFSAWISPEQYIFKSYDSKENLMVVSPDASPFRDVILRILEGKGLKTFVLQNLTYIQFKEVIGRAKWALTFGEGLDGYILEPVFSGAFGFAVYNEHFFTEDYKSMKGIYMSYEDMAQKIISDIDLTDKAEVFATFQREQYDLCAKHYSYSAYQENIRNFYLENYTYK